MKALPPQSSTAWRTLSRQGGPGTPMGQAMRCWALGSWVLLNVCRSLHMCREISSCMRGLFVAAGWQHMEVMCLRNHYFRSTSKRVMGAETGHIFPSQTEIHGGMHE